MKDEFNKYGKRLTEQEYASAVALNDLDETSEKRRRKTETNLMIDRYLSEDFPQERREHICAARERATRKFLSPIFHAKALAINVGMKLGIIKDPPGFDLDRAARIFAEEFTREKDLATEDLIQFLGEEIAPAVKKLRPEQDRIPK